MNNEETIRRWAAEALGSPYVYGGAGQPCTVEYRRQRMAQYPRHAAAIRASCPVLSGARGACAGCRYDGRSCFDCAQLTRRALETVGIRLPSGASSQWSAGPWAQKGPIARLPRQRVCVVFRESGDPAYPMAHAGLYLGDGYAVDARSHMQGVLRCPVERYPWTHYALPDGLEGEDTAGELAPGARGEHVRRMQRLLMLCGYQLPRHGADGVFGAETLSALDAFQSDNGLPARGRADDTALKLLADMADKAADGSPLERRLRALEETLAACAGCPHRKEATA